MSQLFGPRRERIDWRALSSVDVENIARSQDIDALQGLLHNVAFCDLDSETFTGVDRNFMKLLKLAQLMIEYVLHCQEQLQASLEQSETRLSEALQMGVDLSNKLKQSKAENRKRRHIIASYQQMLGAGDSMSHMCKLCGKAFTSAPFLHAHVHRRHPDHADTYVFEPAAARPRPETQSHAPTSDPVQQQKIHDLEHQIQLLQQEIKLTREHLQESVRRQPSASLTHATTAEAAAPAPAWSNRDKAEEQLQQERQRILQEQQELINAERRRMREELDEMRRALSQQHQEEIASLRRSFMSQVESIAIERRPPSNVSRFGPLEDVSADEDRLKQIDAKIASAVQRGVEAQRQAYEASIRQLVEQQQQSLQHSSATAAAPLAEAQAEPATPVEAFTGASPRPVPASRTPGSSRKVVASSTPRQKPKSRRKAGDEGQAVVSFKLPDSPIVNKAEEGSDQRSRRVDVSSAPFEGAETRPHIEVEHVSSSEEEEEASAPVQLAEHATTVVEPAVPSPRKGGRRARNGSRQAAPAQTSPLAKVASKGRSTDVSLAAAADGHTSARAKAKAAREATGTEYLKQNCTKPPAIIRATRQGIQDDLATTLKSMGVRAGQQRMRDHTYKRRIEMLEFLDEDRTDAYLDLRDTISDELDAFVKNSYKPAPAVVDATIEEEQDVPEVSAKVEAHPVAAGGSQQPAAVLASEWTDSEDDIDQGVDPVQSAPSAAAPANASTAVSSAAALAPASSAAAAESAAVPAASHNSFDDSLSISSVSAASVLADNPSGQNPASSTAAADAEAADDSSDGW